MNQPAYHDRDELELFNWPELVALLMPMSGLILGPGEVSEQLKGEVFTVASLASGCRHCQAHGAYGLHLAGTDNERIGALWEFEQSTLFTEGERAALRLARDAGASPNAVTPLTSKSSAPTWARERSPRSSR